MLQPRATSLFLLIWTISGICWAQSTTTAATVSKTKLEQLEDLGISYLSSLLSPSPTATPSSSSSTSSSKSSTTTSSLDSLTATKRATSTSESSTTAAPSATTSSSTQLPKTTRNIFLVLGTVLGAFILILLAIVIWQCLKYRKRKAAKRRAATPLDYNEFPDSYDPPSSIVHPAYRPRSLSSGERYYTPPPQSLPQPQMAQHHHQHHRNSSHASLIPSGPTPPPPQHFRSSYSSGGANPFDDSHGTIDIGYRDYSQQNVPVSPILAHQDSGYSDRSRPSLERHSRHSQQSLNRVPIELPESKTQEERPLQSVPDRVSTPMFGVGKAPGERASVPHTAPVRNPQRRSLPMSPLANEPLSRGSEFDFGFGNETAPRRARAASQSQRNMSDAHHRF
ncbi:hypothetical protein EJ08DRAFT_649625 [Tothia fuscella]|uniref:Mid2 domain-containing protein n=1 Tax=Tothia fuscella TaxID=1048955 RepID=A0A9P4NSU2_9PEZI|nr:hypothetical protein EJ08DRAFT_649625 [Tothia fuscella]